MKPGPKPKKKRGGWKNPASAANARKATAANMDNLLEGLTNLETGEPAGFVPTRFASMRAAAYALKIDIAILKDARSRDCNAFEGSGAVHRERLIAWLKKNAQLEEPGKWAGGLTIDGPTPTPDEPPDNSEQTEYVENYTIPDEAGGVGQTLKSLQAYERRAKQKLDGLEKSTKLHPSIKTELVKQAQDAWLKVVNSLLKYDLAVDMAKRESGELVPLADAVKGVQALLAWHTVGTSDALRNVIPELEGKTKYEIATLLDPALRSAIYRNFKLGVKLGKIPEWMGRTAGDFIKAENPLSLDNPRPSTNLNDY